jgi:hypothetical protein
MRCFAPQREAENCILIDTCTYINLEYILKVSKALRTIQLDEVAQKGQKQIQYD